MANRTRSAATRRTVIVAGAANVLVGVVKLVAGIMSGSSAMLAESAHSAADTLDQVFLLMSLRTMHIGPDSLIVAARVALADELVADQAEDLAEEIDSRLSESLPVRPHVFIDPTQSRPGGSLETGEVRRPLAP